MPMRTGVTNLPLNTYIKNKDEQLRIITESGFDSVDYFLSEYNIGLPKSVIEEPINQEYFIRKKLFLEASGAVVHQTHAPYPIYTGDKKWDDEAFSCLEKSIEATALLGAKYMVIHPAKPPKYRYAFCKPIRKAINMGLLSALLPALTRYGVIVAIENMFYEDKKGLHPTACSRGAEMLDYIKTLNDPHYSLCYDSGHANLIYHDGGIKLIEELGTNIAVCHLHDDFGKYDDHLIPGEGEINWVRLLTALKKSGFG
jgi:sugar phosphate isomerase/epimerase